jgi:hypothetical protein
LKRQSVITDSANEFGRNRAFGVIESFLRLERDVDVVLERSSGAPAPATAQEIVADFSNYCCNCEILHRMQASKQRSQSRIKWLRADPERDRHDRMSSQQILIADGK